MTVPHESAMPPRRAQHLPTGPLPGTVMHPAYAGVIARLAYVWGWPLVNMHNRREVFRKVPSVTYVGGAPMAPPNHLGMYSDYVDALQRVVAHPNQGRGLRIWNRLARRVPRRRAGPGFRQPLLGLCAL